MQEEDQAFKMLCNKIQELHIAGKTAYKSMPYKSTNNDEIKMTDKLLRLFPNYNGCLVTHVLADEIMEKLEYIAMVEGTNTELPKEQLDEIYSILYQFSKLLEEHFRRYPREEM